MFQSVKCDVRVGNPEKPDLFVVCWIGLIWDMRKDRFALRYEKVQCTVVAWMQMIQLKDLKKIAALGAGAFGQVFLVKHNNKYYALKCLSKALVMETGLQVWPPSNTCSCHRAVPQANMGFQVSNQFCQHIWS